MKRIDPIKILKSEKGVTLVEVLLSIALLAIIAGPLLSMVLASYQNNMASKTRTEAVAFAEEVMSDTKAQKLLAEEPTIITGDGSLFAERIIEAVAGGTAGTTTDGAITYDPGEEAENADIELVISQKTDESVSKITFKDRHNGINKTFNATSAAIGLNLGITGGTGYSYRFGYLTDYTALQFVPGTSNIVKLKLTYESDGGSSPDPVKTVNIDTNAAMAPGDLFRIYVIDRDKENSCVNFFNKGSSSFEVNYMDTQAFDISELDRLYKVTVNIRDKTKTEAGDPDQHPVIYTTYSYVKK